jgi:hypothetical protein
MNLTNSNFHNLMPRKHKALILALLTLSTLSTVAAGDKPEEVIRALYKAHRPWEHKSRNLRDRAVLSKYFSPELTKLFLKNAQLERDCPKGDLCGLDFDPILDAQNFDDYLNFNLRITEVTRPQTGRFEARFRLFNEEKPEYERLLVFQLVQLKNGWRIDDIIYPNDNTSLKAVITALVSEAAHLKE